MDVVIVNVDRLRNTASGNPVWSLTWNTGWGYTQPDGAVGYDVDTDLIGKRVRLVFDTAGRIVNVATL